MNITFTEEAIAYIEKTYINRKLKLKFLHDVGDCSCADGGVPTLAFIEQANNNELIGQSNYMPFYYQPEHAIYYSNHMTIDFYKNYYSLKLSSDSQLYTNNMRLITLA